MPRRSPILLALVLTYSAFGQTSSFVQNGIRQIVPWSEMAGKMVTAEGIAWGAVSKGDRFRLVMPTGTVYLNASSAARTAHDGRLIRVSGTLKQETVPAAPKGAQGYSRSFKRYVIDVMYIETLEKVKQGQLTPSTRPWLRVGMPAEEAVGLIQKGKFERYLLAIAASKDGSGTHSYQTYPSELVVFNTLRGQVNAIWKVQLKGIGKSDDQWTSMKAYPLPTQATQTTQR